MESNEPESRGQEFNWWHEFFSGDNSKVNTMAVLSVILAAPIVLLASLALTYHIFYLHKGLDSSSVQLFVALITASTGGLGVSMYARSTLSVARMDSIFPKRPVPDPKKEPSSMEVNVVNQPKMAPRPDNPDAQGET